MTSPDQDFDGREAGPRRAEPRQTAAPDSPAPQRVIAGCATSHRVLLSELEEVVTRDGGDALSGPSMLPGWSRAHVVSHLARNADSFVVAFSAAARGEVVARYPGGAEQREREIASGAGRPAGELVADLRRATARLEDAWAAADRSTWSGSTLDNSGARESIVDTVFFRWRETVVHHADLGLGFGRSQWPALWVRMELERQMMTWRASRPMGMGTLPPSVSTLPDVDKVAWFLGRLPVAPDDAGRGSPP